MAIGKGAILARTHETRKISRSDFLKLSGAGLTGAALFGVAGCGGGGTISGGGGGGGGGGSTFIFGRGADSVSLDPINASITAMAEGLRFRFIGRETLSHRKRFDQCLSDRRDGPRTI